MNVRILVVSAALLSCVFIATTIGQGPGYRGGRGADPDFVVDRNDFHFLLAHHDQIRREVREVPGGVETITESDNQEVAATIQKHVAAMYQRLENSRPIRRRDPLFAELFQHADKIKMEVENTAKGIRVIETAEDDYAVQLIRAHAKVVSGFAERGFEEARQNHAVPVVGKQPPGTRDAVGLNEGGNQQ